MSIDIKEFTGVYPDSAAESQPVVPNSYQNQLHNEEFPVYEEFLEAPEQPQEAPMPEVPAEAEAQLSKQELNFRALREEVERIKTEREHERNDFKEQLELLKANQLQRLPEKEAPPRRMFEGLNEDDIPSVKEIESAWTRKEAEYQARIEEMQVAQQYPDYNEVLQKHLSPLLKQKPHLAEGIQGARNKALFAYELGKMAQMHSQAPLPVTSPEPPKPSPVAQRIVENARRPGTLSNAGGQGGLSKADYYASMSDNEFMTMASKYLGEI